MVTFDGVDVAGVEDGFVLVVIFVTCVVFGFVGGGVGGLLGGCMGGFEGGLEGDFVVDLEPATGAAKTPTC